MKLHTFEFIDCQDWCRKAEDGKDFLGNQRTFLPLFESENLKIDFHKCPQVNDAESSKFYGAESIITAYRVEDFKFPQKINGSILMNLGKALIKDSSLLVLVRENLSITEGYGSRRWAEYQLNKWPWMHNYPLCKINTEQRDVEIFDRIKIYPMDGIQHISIPALYLSVRADDRNIYHWIIETIVRLKCLEVVPELKSIPIIVREPLSQFQLATLEILGVTNQIFITNGHSFSADNLFYPSIPSPPPFHSGAMQWLRKSFLRRLPELSSAKRKRLYISRCDASNRKVKNESELFSFLKTLGFEFLVMTELDPYEQIDAFRSAEFIVLPHGAAGAHLLFIPSDCRVIELHSPYFLQNCYFAICHSLAFNYRFLLGEEHSDIHEIQPDSLPDYYIDIEKLKILLL
jgi:hypothetical protein